VESQTIKMETNRIYGGYIKTGPMAESSNYPFLNELQSITSILHDQVNVWERPIWANGPLGKYHLRRHSQCSKYKKFWVLLSEKELLAEKVVESEGPD